MKSREENQKPYHIAKRAQVIEQDISLEEQITTLEQQQEDLESTIEATEWALQLARFEAESVAHVRAQVHSTCEESLAKVVSKTQEGTKRIEAAVARGAEDLNAQVEKELAALMLTADNGINDIKSAVAAALDKVRVKEQQYQSFDELDEGEAEPTVTVIDSETGAVEFQPRPPGMLPEIAKELMTPSQGSGPIAIVHSVAPTTIAGAPVMTLGGGSFKVKEVPIGIGLASPMLPIGKNQAHGFAWEPVKIGHFGIYKKLFEVVIKADWQYKNWRIEEISLDTDYRMYSWFGDLFVHLDHWDDWYKRPYRYKGHPNRSGYVIRRTAHFKLAEPTGKIGFKIRKITLTLYIHGDGTFHQGETKRYY